MPVRTSWLVFLSALIVLLSSCGQGDDSRLHDIIGRWEAFTNEDHSQGIVFEFQADGEAFGYEFDSPIRYLYPDEYDQRRYLFSVRDDTLSFSGRYMDNKAGAAIVITGDIYRVSFVSLDEIILTPVGGETEGFTLQRVSTTEVPFGVRATLGNYLVQEGLTLVSVERLEGNWADAFPGYVEADKARFKEFVGSEQWVAFIQAAGEAESRLLVIGKTNDRWVWILLQKGE